MYMLLETYRNQVTRLVAFLDWVVCMRTTIICFIPCNPADQKSEVCCGFGCFLFLQHLPSSTSFPLRRTGEKKDLLPLSYCRLCCNNRINNMTQLEPLESPTVAQRLRRASTSVTGVVMNYNPQPGMWAATGTAIAYAPTLEELRRPVNGGQNIVYNAHGHGARSTPSANPDYSAVTTTETKTSAVLDRTETFIESPASVDGPDTSPGESEGARVPSEEKHNWKETSRRAVAVGWKFVRTPTGFLMTIYGLNIVAWAPCFSFFSWMQHRPWTILTKTPTIHPARNGLNLTVKSSTLFSALPDSGSRHGASETFTGYFKPGYSTINTQ